MHPESEGNKNFAVADAETGKHHPDGYPFPLDAVVLAGTHQNAKRLITGRNKAFLEVGGEVLVRRVVNALLESETIDQVFVVGPADDLLQTFSGFPNRVHIIAQRGKMRGFPAPCFRARCSCRW